MEASREVNSEPETFMDISSSEYTPDQAEAFGGLQVIPTRKIYKWEMLISTRGESVRGISVTVKMGD